MRMMWIIPITRCAVGWTQESKFQEMQVAFSQLVAKSETLEEKAVLAEKRAQEEVRPVFMGENIPDSLWIFSSQTLVQRGCRAT